jgi:hypothetical protein
MTSAMASANPKPVRRVCYPLSTPLQVQTISLAEGLLEVPPILPYYPIDCPHSLTTIQGRIIAACRHGSRFPVIFRSGSL